MKKRMFLFCSLLVMLVLLSACDDEEPVRGEITVPAATYTQNSDGTWTITPGVSTLTVTGTV